MAGVENHAANADWSIGGVDLLAGAVASFRHDEEEGGDLMAEKPAIGILVIRSG